MSPYSLWRDSDIYVDGFIEKLEETKEWPANCLDTRKKFCGELTSNATRRKERWYIKSIEKEWDGSILHITITVDEMPENPTNISSILKVDVT